MAAPTVYKTVSRAAKPAVTSEEKTKIKTIVNAFFNHFNAKHLS